MLRKALTALAVASMVAIAACATPGGVTITTPTISTDPGPTAGVTIEQVQNIVVRGCGFLPTVSTVADIITTFTGGGAAVAIADRIASAICNAVAPRNAARRGAGQPRVNGVAIHGRFVTR